jgi:hypothetical protein
MPKVVIDLVKLDENISLLEEIISKNKEAMVEKYVLTTHSIDNEIKYLNDFRNTFDFAITQKQNELLKNRLEGDPEACKSIKEVDGQVSISDQYGNTFYAKPFEYSYVELTYGNYKKFNKVRFLGEVALVIPTRFEFQNVEHKISPTTLKLFENIHKIKEEYVEKSVLESGLDFLKNLDQNCDRARRGEKPAPKADWKHFFKNYFYPSAKWKERDDILPKFEYQPKFSQKELAKYLKEIQDNKTKIKQIVDSKNLESKADPKKENPAKNSKQDSDKQKTQTPACPDVRPNLLSNLDSSLNNLKKQQIYGKIENWSRRFDPSCIVRELRDCLLPPDLDFCDFIFKDISISNYYQKLGLLKNAGLGDLYSKLEKKLEEDFGITQLKQKEKEIKDLEKRLQEEDSLRERLNQTIEEFQAKSQDLIQQISSFEDSLQIINANLQLANLSGTTNEIRRLQKQKTSLEKRITQVRDRLRLLTQQNEVVPGNLDRLNANYDRNLAKKQELERDFSNKIAENKFNQRQAELISQGKNLEAVLLVPNEDEKYSKEAIATVILNGIDTVIPLENLCRLLFSLLLNRSFKTPLQIPDNFFGSLTTRWKDPFYGLSTNLQELLVQLLISLLFNLLDAMLKGLCDSIGNVVSNSSEANQLFRSIGDELSNIGEDALTNSINFASAVGNTVAQSVINDLGQAPNKFFEFGQQSPLSEWDLSLDGKSFVVKNPPVLDLSQIENFIKTSITGYSSQVILDMISENQERNEVLEETPPVQTNSLTIEEARQEINCMFSRSISLLTPTETINLLTKNPDQNTVNIVNKIASICAPKISNNYPGDSLVELLGELGILAGALDIKKRIEDIEDLNRNSPITEKILCERYDNTRAFRQSLLSETIEPQLAIEILDEIQNKQQEEFAYIVDSITQLAESNILERPQTAKQFYLEAISQALDLQKQGQRPKSLQDLNIQEEQKGKINLKEVIEQKVKENRQNNSMLNSMFDMTTESLLRPYRDRFRRDSENYINAISTTIQYEKEIKKTQLVKTQDSQREVPTMEFLNSINMGYVPALQIMEGKVTVLPEKGETTLQAEQDLSNIVKSFENDIENYQFYALLEEEFPEPKEQARSDLQIIKSIELPEDLVAALKLGIFTIGYVRSIYEGLISPVLQLVSGGYQKIEEYLEALFRKQSGGINSRTFIMSEVNENSIQIKMLPSYVLPFSKNVGSKTLLTNKAFSEDKNGGILLTAEGGPLLISNGYVEDNFIYSLYNTGKQATILDKKLEVGQKYKNSLSSFEGTQISADRNGFQISISSKHKNNPLISEEVAVEGLLSDESEIDYDSISSKIPTIQTLQCAAKNISFGQELNTDLLTILTKQTTQETLKQAISTWKVEYSEAIDQNNKIQSEFSLKSNGLVFSPTGTYSNFYHDTVYMGNESSISNEIKSKIDEKYGTIKSRYECFGDYIDQKQKNYLIPKYGIDRIRNIYTEIVGKFFSKFYTLFDNPRLLDVQEGTEQKLIEFLDITREQTQYEKENSLDPNIMNFVGLKQQLKELYEIEKEDVLTEEQQRGEQGSENKFTKSAKNILLISMIRLCVNEYILKNIFIFDSLSFTKELEQFNFVIKDLANFVIQESKRVGIGREIQKQSIKYYDLMVESGKIAQQQNIEDLLNQWKKSNSLSSVESNPKMIEIVKNEFLVSLKKFRESLKCGETLETDVVIDSFISDIQRIDCPLVNGALLQDGDTVWIPFLGLDYTEGDIYIEKYCRIPNLSLKNIKSLSSYNRNRLLNWENRIFSLAELSLMLEQLRIPLEDFFDCNSENSIFDHPISIGVRIMMITNREDKIESQYTNQEIIRERKYVLTEPNFENGGIKNQYFVSEIASEEYPIDVSKLQVDGFTKSSVLQNIYSETYTNILYPRLTKNKDTQIFFKYCLAINEILQIFLSHNFLFHNDQDGRFLFEGTKMMIARMYEANINSGNSKKTMEQLDKMLEMQKRNEENTGSPLGPSLEALKFYYRTPIQILKGQATLVDPNVALADLIVKGAAMAGNLTGQNINIPYSLASLALLPFPLFNGVAPPIPPLSSYNIAMPVGPVFLGLEPLLWDLPYYQNKNKGKLPSGNGKDNNSQNPLFCELFDEENEE